MNIVYRMKIICLISFKHSPQFPIEPSASIENDRIIPNASLMQFIC